MKRILLSNDDGYRAEGIRSIARALSEWAEVKVVAPDRERSGSGHAITLDRPLRLRPMEESVKADLAGEWHLVDGTPTDCVNLGLHVLFAGEKPDAVVSGINHGVNLGNDVTYSGTVGGALEGQTYGVPGFALSQRTDGAFDFSRTAERASEFIRRALMNDQFGCNSAAGKPPGQGTSEVRTPLLNLNFPIGELGDFEVTVLGTRSYRDSVASRSDPRGRSYYWIAGSPDWDATEGTDVAAVRAGRVSVTPLTGDLTERAALADLRLLLA